MKKWKSLDGRERKTYLTTLDELLGHVTGKDPIPAPELKEGANLEATRVFEEVFESDGREIFDVAEINDH